MVENSRSVQKQKMYLFSLFVPGYHSYAATNLLPYSQFILGGLKWLELLQTSRQKNRVKLQVESPL